MTLQDGGLLLLSYLLGSIPFGYLIARFRTGGDIRRVGSGNIGATNVLRTQGKGWGLLTLLLDALKSSAAVVICAQLSPIPWMGAAGGAAAVVGHCFPVYIGFRGGKGIASGVGAFAFIAPWVAGLALGVFLIVVLVTRWVALGSVVSSLSFAGFLFLFRERLGLPVEVAWIGLGIALLLVARHHTNLRRLLQGTEPTLWGKGSKKP